MRIKILALSLGLLLVAAACNKTPANTTGEGTSQQNTDPNQQTSLANSPNSGDSDTPEIILPKTVEIKMTASGFEPKEVTVKKGDTVKFINSDTKSRWPASAPHPTHINYPSFDPKKGIAVGESWSFTFDQVGAWPFHDHLTSSLYGKVTVTE